MSEQPPRPGEASAGTRNDPAAGTPRPGVTRPPETTGADGPARDGRTAPTPTGGGAEATAPPPTTATQTRTDRMSGAGRLGETPDGRARGQGEGPARSMSAGYGSPPPEPDGSPGGLNKPILAGAAILGAVLVTVPLLMLGSADRPPTSPPGSTVVEESADTVLEPGDDTPRGGVFVPESPISSPSHSASPSASASAGVSPKTPTRAAQDKTSGPTPLATPRRGQAQGGSPSSGAPDLTNVLLRNASIGSCADLPGKAGGRDGETVQQAPCAKGTGDNQMWTLEKGSSTVGPGGSGLYIVRNVKDRCYMDVPYYGGVGPGTVITEAPCALTEFNNQLFWLQKRPDGTYWIRNYSSNHLCLDVMGDNDPTPGRPLTLWHCSDDNDQKWRFAG